MRLSRPFEKKLAPICTGDRLLLKCDGTRAEIRFRPSVKRMSPFKSAGASVQSTTGSRGVSISGSNAGYTMLRGSGKGTGYPLHSPVTPSFPSRASPCAITFQLDAKRLFPFPHPPLSKASRFAVGSHRRLVVGYWENCSRR